MMIMHVDTILSPDDLSKLWAELAQDEQLPDQIGPFSVLEEIGQGGMGSVYLAEQREPVQRRVANPHHFLSVA